jgi:DNA-binding CsgD family transcriptional regulator
MGQKTDAAKSITLGQGSARTKNTQPAEMGWPFVGRAAELERVTGLIRSGARAAILAGPAGVGKTRLGTECLAIANSEGFVPVRVAATQAAAGLPFGAFASFVPELAPGSALVEVLRQVAHAVAERGQGKPVAILVDDAHLLDGSSAALTHLLATTEQTFVLATLRSGERAPDAIVALWKDELADRIELEPLTQAQVGDLLASALHGPVNGATVKLLRERTDGNALFLRELVMAAVEAGVLREDEGMWRLSGSLPISPRLLEIVEARLGGIADSARRTLGLLALGEPLGVDVLQRIDAATDLEILEHRGLVQVEQSGRRLDARLGHPLYGEVLRAQLSPMRARATARALADALESTGGSRREDTLRIATLKLDGGGTVHLEIMLRAASTARERCDFPLAERLARAAVDAEGGFDASLILGQVCWLQGHADEAEEQLSALVPQAATDTQRALLASTRITILYFGLNRTAAALRVADEAEATIADLACRDAITTERARLLGRSGRCAAAVDLIEPLLDRVSGPTLVAACLAAASSMGPTGQTIGAIEATERGLSAHLALTGPPLPFGPYYHHMLRCLAVVHAGRLAEASVLGSEEYEKALADGSIESQAAFSACLAWAALFEGRVATAAHYARESAGGCRQLGWSLHLRNGLTVLAHAVALQGNAGKARAVLSEIDALGVPATDIYGPELLRARAWTAVAGGDAAVCRARLEEAATMARLGGAFAFESAALHDLARVGHAAKVAPRLHQLAEVVEGPLAPARAAHAAAMATADAAELDAASVAFEDLGAVLLAAEAAADAAVAWRRGGEPRRGAAAERRSSGLADRCEGARTPALATTASARFVLTPRELEIARLAAGGLSNKEIAMRLFLSHRTVENQLHAAYEKLGVRGRAELAQALS